MTKPGNNGPATATPLVPVSWGELIDKITILEIKSERIKAAGALRNIQTELSQLQAIATEILALDPRVQDAKKTLKRLNEGLWEIEDSLRACERDRRFDQGFIELARQVYQTNDRRSAIKREINRLTGSDLAEEKQYTAYDRRD